MNHDPERENMKSNSSFVRLAVLAAVMAITLAGRTVAAGLEEINPPPERDNATLIALVGGTLIDGEQDRPVQDAVVVVRGSSILRAGSRQEVEIPPGAVVHDIAGMTVMPGLIDSHFHSINDLRTPALFLSHGLTAFRDPGHPFRFYQAVAQTKQAMPRVFLCGAHLDAYPPIWPQQAVIIDNNQRARDAVNTHVDRGASGIKIYFRLPLAHFQTICDTAAARGVPVTAHLELVDADDAIRAGLDGVEHITSFGTALADPQAASDFKETIAANPKARGELRYRLWSKLDLDGEKARRLVRLIVDQNVVVSPTLAVFERRAGKKNATAFEAAGFANMLKFVGQCHRAGATMVVGSHTHVPFAQPGWAYQRELELLVEAGLSPMDAIQSGTINNARFFRAEDRLGSIEVGKAADLVIVEGDPSREIKAMRDVKHVMLHGGWVGDPPKMSRPR